MTAVVHPKPARKVLAQEISRPAGPGFVALTLALGLFLDLLPWYGLGLLAKPDFLALMLSYWCIHQPRRVGFLAACLLGLVMDVADGVRLGEHALAYSALAYAALLIHRRVAMLGIVQQFLYVLGMLLSVRLISLVVRVAAGADLIGWGYFAGAFTGAALWPIVSRLFQIPQRPREAGHP